LPVIDRSGHIIATTGIISGEHHDAYELKETIKTVFATMKHCGLDYEGAYFNADSSFDTRDVRKQLWNLGVKPTIDENKRNRKRVKRGRKRHFNHDVYKDRFVIERTFAWIDKFRTLLIRFERKDVYWLGFHFLAFTLINLRDLIGKFN
jgi:Transposase DDE domain